MTDNTFHLNRRSFLKIGAAAGGGLILGFNYLTSSCTPAKATPKDWQDFNAFLQVATDGSVTIFSPNPEVGQGVKTAMPMILAEELDADWSKVIVQQAPLDTEKYTRQVAGGSGSIRTTWESLRTAGATARAMLVAAAAARWQVNTAEITTQQGVVSHAASGKSATYGELATEAAALEVPTDVTLKAIKDFTLVGKATPGVDNHAIFTGTAEFGIDFKREGMRYAVVARPPAFGQIVGQLDDSATRAIPGVVDVIPVDQDKVAVLAESTWAAMQGRNALKIAWTAGTPPENTTDHEAQMRALLDKPADEPRRKDGDAPAAFRKAAKVVEAEFSCPFLPHNAMEPMNFFADVREDGAELIGPTQTPARAQTQVAELTGLDPAKISVQMTRMGGGFGRRLSADFVVEAAKISQLAKAPVKVQWTREDDMGGGIYRPTCQYRYRAALDSAGNLTGFQVRGSGVNVGNPMREHNFPAGAVANVLIEGHNIDSNVTTGPWRAPVHNFVAFAEQSFLDEVALAAGKDPVQFRLDLLTQAENQPVGQVDYDTKRFRAVIELAAEKAGWGKAPAGVFQGFSAYFSFNSYIAQVAEVVLENNRPRVKKIYCAVDCGVVINPSGAENQVVGGIIDGLGHAMYSQLTIADGQPQQLNFDKYRLIRMAEAPPVEVFFVQSEVAPTGLGEPALPPTAAAVGNAIFAATGERLRAQPFIQSELLG